MTKQQFVDERYRHEATRIQLYLVVQVIRVIVMDNQIEEAVGIAWTLRKEYCNSLQEAGYI